MGAPARAALVVVLLGARAQAAPRAVAPGWTAVPVRAAGDVVAVAETPDGFLWLGGQDGLARFDGQHVEPMVDAALRGPDRYVRAVFTTRTGVVWLATGEGRLVATPAHDGTLVDMRGRAANLYRVEDGRLSRPDVARALPSAWVWAFAEDAQGTIWLGTEAGIARARPQGTALDTIVAGLPSPFVTSLYVDGEAVWIGTAGGLARWSRGRLEAVPSLAGTPISGVAAGRTGVVVAAGGALYQMDGLASRRLPTGDVHVTSIVSFDGRGLWLMGGPEVFRWNGTETKPELVLQGGSQAASVMRARDRTLWVASVPYGLIAVRETAAVRVPWLGEATPFAFFETRAGELWSTSTNGVFRVAADGRVHRFATGTDVPDWSPRSLAETPDGRVLVTGDGVVLAFHDGRWSKHPIAFEGAGRKAEALLVTRAGDLLVATEREVLVFARADPSAQPRALVTRGTPCPGPFGPLLESRDGSLWVGGQTGLSRVQNGEARCLGAAQGLPSERIAALHEDDAGALWVGTFDPVGLARVRGDRVTGVAAAGRGDGPERVYGISEDAAGGIWISSDRGVARGNKAEVEAAMDGRAPEPRWVRLGISDGLPHPLCISRFGPSMLRTRGGRLMVATLEGGVTIEPTRVTEPRSPRLVIDAVSVGGVRVPPHALVLPPGAPELEVRYAAPSFVRGAALTFQHRLAGLEADWVDAGSARVVRYGRLPPGEYQLALRVLDGGWPAGAPLTLDLRVAPRLWQRPLVWVALLALLALTTWAVHWLRLRRIEARYRLVQDERARIARDLHDGLAQGFTSIALHLDALRLALDGPRERAQSLLERARSVVERCRTEARRAISGLRGQSPGRLSIADAIAGVVTTAAEETGVVVRLARDGREPGLPAAWLAVLEQELPLIVQEAITNAVRHGHARVIDVAVEAGAGGVTVSIVDDGEGFDPVARVAGHGLVGMHERAARLGGTLNVQSAPGAGARVVVTIASASAGSLPREPTR